MDDAGMPVADSTRRPLDAGHLTRSLTAPVGPLSRVTVVSASASTNTDLVDALRDGAPWPHLSVLVAEWQTNGRGRLGRTWVTPPGTALTASFVLRPDGVAKDHMGWIPLVSGLAVARALRDIGVMAKLKWPNDVVVDDPSGKLVAGWGVSRKVAGVLCEVVGDAIVVGIGVNVSQKASELPVAHGTSLLLVGSSHLDRGEILGAIATELISVLEAWGTDGGQAAIPAEVSQMCDTLGKQVLVERPGAPVITGFAASLSAEGGLLVEVSPGQIEKVMAGDVFLRRA